MPQHHTIRGVLMTLQHDAWWLTDTPPDPATTSRAKGPAFALIQLPLLGGILFWHHTPGLSLAIFAAAVFAAASPRPKSTALAVLTLAVLPVVDYVQPLVITILVLGRPSTMAINRGLALITLLKRLPLALPQDLATGLSHLPRLPALQFARNRAFPLGGGLILLSQANPVLAHWIAALTNLPLDPVDLALRALFWCGLALILGPLLTEAEVTPITMRLPNLTLGLNAASVTHALILFNAMLALQTAMGLAYLYRGTTPPGMTLATYAHRGEYPLLATALLAGAIALAARPWLGEHPSLKPLLLLWLAQNVLLTLSALYRLDPYVQSFGLTYLRVHAAIWMGLAAAGPALTLARIAAQKSDRWLLVRSMALGLGTLYLCAFVNFAAVIAQVNLALH